jgi:hypothetical protein
MAKNVFEKHSPNQQNEFKNKTKYIQSMHWICPAFFLAQIYGPFAKLVWLTSTRMLQEPRHPLHQLPQRPFHLRYNSQGGNLIPHSLASGFLQIVKAAEP